MAWLFQVWYRPLSSLLSFLPLQAVPTSLPVRLPTTLSSGFGPTRKRADMPAFSTRRPHSQSTSGPSSFCSRPASLTALG